MSSQNGRRDIGFFFKKVDFFKGNKSIFFLNNRPMIFGLFAFFLPAFADVIFMSYSPLVNTYRLQKTWPQTGEKLWESIKKSAY